MKPKAKMKPGQSSRELAARLGATGRPLARLTAAEGVAAVLAFYAERRAARCRIDEDGDVLLYQWGVYDEGRGETFQLDVTRQFILTGEDEPYQLSLTFHFKPTPQLRKLGDGAKWCQTPDDLAKFRKSVERSAAYRAVADAAAKKVTLEYGQC